MLKAGIDLDGVIGNVSHSIINYINGMYKQDFTKKNLVSYHIYDWFPKMNKEQCASLFKNPGFYLNMSSLPKAVESINRLRKDGWWIDIVTARDWGCLTVTVDWLRDEKLKYDRISFVESDQKVHYAKDEEFDIFVEDNPNTVNQLVDVVSLVYLVDAPYNKKVNNGVLRIRDLNSMLNNLKRRNLYGTDT